MAVGVALVGIGFAAQLDVGHILEPQHLTVGRRTDDDLAELLGGHSASAVFHGILEGVVGILAQLSGGRLDVLLGQRHGDVGRNQAVLRHHVGLHPDAHGVVGAEGEELADALDALDARLDVDVHVVGQEHLVVAVVGAVEREDHQHGGLAFHGGDADLGDLGGEGARSRSHAVLHVDGGHVGVGALLEVDRNGGRTGVGSVGLDVHHVLDAVDGLLERHDHRFLDGFGARTGVRGADRDRGRRNVGILLHGQGRQTDQTGDDDQNGDDRRQDGPFDEMLECHGLFGCCGAGSGGRLPLGHDGGALAQHAHAFGYDRLARGEARPDDVLPAVGDLLHVDHA